MVRVLRGIGIVFVGCVGVASEPPVANRVDVVQVEAPRINTTLVMPAPVPPADPATSPIEEANRNGVDGDRPTRPPLSSGAEVSE